MAVPPCFQDRRDFVIGFAQPPGIELGKLEADVCSVIACDLHIVPAEEDRIRIGDDVMVCTDVRTHVKSSGQIESFRLLPELRFNPISREHLLVGIVGDAREEVGFDRILKIVG